MSKGATEERTYKKKYKENMKETNVSGKKDDNNDNQDNNLFSQYHELSPGQEKIAQWLENLKFRKQLVGGVSEYDVWKKIIELNAMYEDVLKEERIRCNAIIDEYKNTNMNKEGKEKIKNE